VQRDSFNLLYSGHKRGFDGGLVGPGTGATGIVNVWTESMSSIIGKNCGKNNRQET
jgi:hypothetical protein